MKEKSAHHIYVRNEYLLVPDVTPVALGTRIMCTVIDAAEINLWVAVNCTTSTATS